MVSKKVLGPALTGTGAVGASGALAWTLGLLDEEILDDVEVQEEKKVATDPAKQAQPPQEKVDKPAEVSASSKGPQAPSTTLQGPSSSPVSGYKVTVTSQEITGAVARSTFFSSSSATEGDKKAIGESLTWKVEWNGLFESIQIKAGGSENAPVWDCRLRHTSIKKIESDNNSNSELMRQGSDLIKAIENNSTYKERFVENCSKVRTDEEKQSNKEGEIKLEVEKSSDGKIKFKESGNYFQKLWTEDFAGVDKLSQEEEEELLDLDEKKWNIEEIKEDGGKTGKVKISPKEKNNNWFCNISGNFKNNLKGKTFKKEGLEEILKKSKSFGFENEVEWKRYLFRNCRKNNKEITGLTVQAVGRGEWEFKDLKKIYEGMYTNPTTTN